MAKQRTVIKNIIYSFGTRIIILILGFILPRLLITSFGSEVNGLLSTVTQIFTYLALLEAGIGNSAVNALYKPLKEKDYDIANEVMNEAQRYFQKVSIIYGICVLIFAVIYPFCTHSSIGKGTIFWIIILQGLSSVITYYFSAYYTHLLTADGKRYINENIYFLTYVISSILKILLILNGFGVISVQIGFLVISIIKAPCLYFICKRKYGWLKNIKKKNTNYLKERSAFVVHELSTAIFNSTDVFLISTFCDFALASVYTIYNLVYSSLNTILSTINGSLIFLLGQGQYEDHENFVKLYDIYSLAYTGVSFVIFTISFVLIKPFVTLYTQGINDVDYLLPGMAFLFTFINLLSSSRATGSMLITVSGHAENTKVRSIAEAVINLVSSIILVNIFQIRGVFLGTIIALLYRANDIVIYANKNILNRNPWQEYKRIIIYFLLFALVALVGNNFPIKIVNVKEFLLYGTVISLCVSALFIMVTFITNYNLIMYWVKRITK